MKIELENLDGHFKKLNIEVPAERVSHSINDYFHQVAREVTLKGFRKGKAPVDVVKKSYGDSMNGRIIQEIVEQTLREAINQHQLRPADLPNISAEGNLQEGTPFKYSATFENTPPVELKRYTDFSVEKPSEEVSSEEIDQTVKRVQEQMAEFKAAPEGSRVAAGFFVNMDFEAKENGEIFQAASEKGVLAEIGNGSLAEDFEKNILGLSSGDEKTFRVSFPEAKTDAERLPVSGKTLDFNVHIHAIQIRQLPELTDDWASKLGNFKTLLDLRMAISEDLKKQKKEAQYRDFQEKAIAWLIENNPIEVPSTMLSRQMEQLAMDAGVQLSQNGLDEKQIEERLKEWGDDINNTALRQVKSSMLLSAISQKESIQASEEDIRNEILKIAAQSRQKPADVAADLQKRGLLAGLVRQATELKALDWVIKKALS